MCVVIVARKQRREIALLKANGLAIDQVDGGIEQKGTVKSTHCVSMLTR